MSVWRHIPLSSFKILIVVLAVGLAIWQYDLVSGRGDKVGRTNAPVELQFTMNDGRTVSLTDDTTKHTIVLFWTEGSERSVAMVREMMEVYESRVYDTVFNFYAVNMNDSPESMRLAVDFDNTSLPFAYDPEGQFLDKYQIRTFPLTVFFSSTGTVFGTIAGYEEGELAGKLESLANSRRYIGPSGEFKFKVN
ncbi:MAG: thioredoxin fold domain-containing protein [Candidatus Zixiibacteriota bacterium]